MTAGEKVIRPDFAKSDEVREVKRQYVIQYDRMDKIMKDSYSTGPMTEDDFERARLAQKAKDAIELAAMYAVKALTV
jgi:hypothetical protein